MKGRELVKRIREVFSPEQAEVIEQLFDFLDELVKAKDFNELKVLVAQLAEAQRRTDERLAELAEAQRRTDERLAELADEVRILAEGLRLTREDLDKLRKDFGGFTRTYSYAFENEAYRHLPQVLKEKYGIEIIEKFVRTEILGEEINFFAKGKINGKEVYIIGEAKLRFDDEKKDFEQTFEALEKKIKAIKAKFGEVEVIMLIVTHFAKPRALNLAQEKGIIVVQSFEW